MRAGTAKRSRPREERNPRALGHRRLLFKEVAVLKFSCTRCEREIHLRRRALALDICVLCLRKAGQVSIVSPESRLVAISRSPSAYVPSARQAGPHAHPL